MKILVDTREQLPFTFSRFQAEIERAALPCGDYSLPGFEDRVSIERKELNDLIACLMNGNQDRFERELSRGRYYELFYVVVESSLEDVSMGRYRSEMKVHSALQSIFAFSVRYRAPFIWAGNRAGAEYVTFSILSKYLEELGKRFKAASKAQAAQEGVKVSALNAGA
jgi:ERCC4-type nuclease